MKTKQKHTGNFNQGAGGIAKNATSDKSGAQPVNPTAKGQNKMCNVGKMGMTDHINKKYRA